MAVETSQTTITAPYHNEKPIPDHEALAQQIATPLRNIGYFQLFRYATRKDLAIIAFSSLCAALAGAILTMPAVVIGLLVGSIQRIWIGASGVDQVSGELTRYTIFFVYLFAGELVTCYIAAIGFIRTGIVLSSRIREQYLAALLRQNIAFFDSVGAGEIATHMTADANLIRDGISEKVSVAVQCTSSVVTAFIIGFIHDWRLTLIMSSGPVCIALGLAFGGAIVTKYRQQWLGEIADAGTITEEAFSSIRTLVGLNAQTELSVRYEAMLANSERWANKARTAGGALLGAVYAVVYMSIGLGFWMGSRLLVAGTTSYIDILTIVLAIVTGISALSNVITPLQAFAVATAAGSRLYSTIERMPPESLSRPQGKCLESVTGQIELRKVRHIYPARPEITVLNELDLVIEAGKTTAIVGPSGSGKSTIIELIERFYNPLSGDILLDGHRLQNLEIRWLRQQISLVQQSPTLFATTIFENIRHGLVDTQYENLSNEEVQSLVYKAADTANAHKFITELPDGYDTLVGETGGLLSGGQKQRIAIARALVRNPKILLLDEATSALDSQSEAHVQAAIAKASQGRTTVTVAHRLSTIKAADKIVVMVNGRIVEQGTHDTLLQANGTYYNLATTQAINLGEGDVHERDSSSDPAGCRPDSHSEDVEKPSHTIPENQPARNVRADVARLEKLDQPSQAYTLKTLLKFIMGSHRNSLSLMIQSVLWSIQAGAGAPIQAVFLAKCLFALARPPGEYTKLRSESNLWAGMHAVLGLVQLLAYTAQGSTVGICTEKLIRHVSSLTFRALLHKDMVFFDMEEHGVGALVSFLSIEPSSMAGMGCAALSLFVMAFTTLIGALATSIAVGWKLGLVGAATVPVLLICGFLRFRVMYELDAHLRKAYQETASLASEAVSAIRTVMSLNRESKVTAQFREQLILQDLQSIRSSLISSTLFAFSQSASMLCTALTLWYGGTLVIKGEYTLFQFILSHAAVNICGDAAGMVFSSSPDLAKAKNSAARLKSLFDGTRRGTPSSPQTQPILEDKIQFRDVSFTYPTRLEQRILNSLNLSVQKGKYVALVGASGSGKSTVISLLERFYHPISGSITMDGESIFSMDVHAFRDQVALVNQEPALFQGTIRKNLTLGLDASQYSQQDLEKACKDAHILEFIVSLPSGFDTECGVKGNNFSGGQKQRLAIARAILRHPKVLLLDEVTSALDSESQRVVQAALDAAAKGRTTIAIAHRLSAIQNADIIFYLEHGMVVESGTHSELVRKRGKYFAMSSLQNLER